MFVRVKTIYHTRTNFKNAFYLINTTTITLAALSFKKIKRNIE